MKAAIIGGIFVIVAVFLGYYLNLEKADVRYTLSEPIPTKLLNQKTAGSIQQIEVKNFGNANAEKILVKIMNNVDAYELIKYSEHDKAEITKSEESFEMFYPELPPSGSFKIITKTLIYGITKSSLIISHTKGQAKDVLQEKTDFSNLIYIFILAYIIFTLLYTARNMKIDSLQRDAESGSENILKTIKPPFYVNREKWHKYRQTTLNNFFKESYFYIENMDDVKSYHVLSSEKPSYLTDEENSVLFKNARLQLTNYFSSKIKSIYSINNFEKIFIIRKPTHFPDIAWTELMEEANKGYVHQVKKDYSSTYNHSISEIQTALKSPMPSGMLDNYWKSLKNYLQERLYEKALNEIDFSFIHSNIDIDNVFDKLELNLLTSEQIKKLKERARMKMPNPLIPNEAEEIIKITKPNWMDDSDLKLLKEKANTTLNSEIQRKKYNALSTEMQKILHSIPLKNKPDELSEDDWIELKKIEEDVRILAQENRNISKDLSEEKNVDVLKSKIEKQLNIINDIFNDPTVVDRIEEYNNVFSPGNFENLKKISQYLIKSM